tara:strand:+ start:285 stop:497 length:213 start_codon:yes stop_codon:yes gene_type:complete
VDDRGDGGRKVFREEKKVFIVILSRDKVKVYSENNPGDPEKTPKKDFSKVSKKGDRIPKRHIWGFYRKVY